MNPFESSQRKNIPAVLIYVFCGDQVLMIHRVSPDRPNDFHAGKWNGLGGKCEVDESYLETAKRELFEEASLDLEPSQFQFAGFIQFPNFKPHKNEDWSVMIFSAEITPDERVKVPQKNAEGQLHWVPRHEVMSLNLWSGDQKFLPLILSKTLFYGCQWYKNGVVERSDLQMLTPR